MPRRTLGVYDLGSHLELDGKGVIVKRKWHRPVACLYTVGPYNALTANALKKRHMCI